MTNYKLPKYVEECILLFIETSNISTKKDVNRKYRDILRMIILGYSQVDIAGHYGISRERVYQITGKATRKVFSVRKNRK